MTKGRWCYRRDLGKVIKTTLFDTEKINPRSYDKSLVVEAKHNHIQFSQLDNEEWFAAFRRAASECILEEDLDEVEKRHNRYNKSEPIRSVPKVSYFHFN